MLVLLGALAIFHLLILTGLLPREIVRGGRVAGDRPGVVAPEALGLGLTLLFGWLAAASGGLVDRPAPGRGLRIAIAAMTLWFGLNLLGNLSAHSAIETRVFAPASLALALLAARLLRKD